MKGPFVNDVYYSVISEDDGYTRTGYISAEKGIHGAHRFDYRPMLHSERLGYTEQMQGKPAKEAAQIMHAVLVKHVKKWDVKAPLTVAGVSRVAPELIEHIYAIAAGRVPSDVDPQATTQQKSDMDADLAALIAGTDPGLAFEEGNAKNS